MGNFYTNITLLGPDQDQIVEYLSQQGLTAYVSPTDEHATVVYEAQCDTQDTDILERLASQLAAHFNCPALAILNHDDDVLWYRLYTGNGLLDEYDSAPAYFEGDDTPPNGGNAAELCRTFGAEQNATMVEEILRADNERYLFAVERHEALVHALGLTDFSVGFGYTTLDRGEMPDKLEKESLKYVGDRPQKLTYANITLRGPDQEQIVECLSQQNKTAYISPTTDQITVLYDEQSDAHFRSGILLPKRIAEQLASDLSGTLGCTALAVMNNNNDLFWYKLYVGGLLFDEYEATTHRLNGGHAKTLCSAFGVEQKTDSVERILRTPSTSGHTSAIMRHTDLAKALELPAYAVGLGYRQIAQGEAADRLDPKSLRHTGKS